MRELSFVKAISRIEDATVLDPIVTAIRERVMSLVRPQPLRDLLHGVPIGHPLHPLEVQIPIGTWTSALLLDLLPGRNTDRAATALIGAGVVAAAPTAITGWVDWSELHEQQQRVGLVHAAGNIVATGLYALSFVQRVRGKQASGKVLALLGFAAVSGAGFLGGHLSYRLAAGANHTEDVPHLFPTGWHPLAPLDTIPQDELSRLELAGQPLLVHRHGDTVDVLSNVCSHLSAPLDGGQLSTDPATDACVACPWHGSVFSLATGEVVHGPATSPQPRFEVRTTNGIVEVMLPNAG